MIRVETRSGAVYEIDPEAKTSVRTHPRGVEVLGYDVADGEVMHWTSMDPLRVGRPMAIYHDVERVRHTTPVVSITVSP